MVASPVSLAQYVVPVHESDDTLAPAVAGCAVTLMAATAASAASPARYFVMEPENLDIVTLRVGRSW